MTRAAPLRKVVLCADDFALSRGVSEGIAELAHVGRISAASAMTCSPGWQDDAGLLRGVAGGFALGLHLTLTGPEPDTIRPLGPMPFFAPDERFPPIGAVVKNALGRRLPLDEIAAEIERQLSAFEAVAGRPPAFVDGHQHVHALPYIRRVLIDALRQRGWAGRTWLRDPSDRVSAILGRGGSTAKALAIATLAAGFRHAAAASGFETNRGFAGFSAFDPANDLGGEFARFLDRPGRRHLVMCHPGHVRPGERLDDVVEARARERAFLGSDDFAALLAERGVTLVGTPASAEP